MKVLRNELTVNETRTNADWNSYIGEFNGESVMVDYSDWDNQSEYVSIINKKEYVKSCVENELCTAEEATVEFEDICY